MLNFKDGKLNFKGMNVVLGEMESEAATFYANGFKDGVLFIQDYVPTILSKVKDVFSLIFNYNNDIKSIVISDIRSNELDFWGGLDKDISVSIESRKVFIPNTIAKELDEKKWAERSAIYNPDDTMVQRGPANPLFKENKFRKYVIKEDQLTRLLLSSSNMKVFDEIRKNATLLRNKIEVVSIGDLFDNPHDMQTELNTLWKTQHKLWKKNHDVYTKLLEKASNEIDDDDQYVEFESKVFDISNEISSHLELTMYLIDALVDISENIIESRGQD